MIHWNRIPFPVPERIGTQLGRAAHDALYSLEPVEGLFEVGDDVLRVFDADGEPHEVLPDSESPAARRRELAVRGGGGMDGERVDVAQRRGLDAEL